jgi:hypothetical protein
LAKATACRLTRWCCPGDPFLCAVANHQRPRTRQVLQAFEHPLGTNLLDYSNENRGAGEYGEDDRFREIAEDEIDRGRCEE